jgi:cytochrome c-type biogenesis protein CcmE
MVLRNPTDLRHYLTRQPDLFPTTVTKRLMMYALNRELEYYDMPEVRKIVRDAAASNYTAAALITGVVNSDAFRRQGAEARPKGPATKTAANVTSGATAAKGR